MAFFYTFLKSSGQNSGMYRVNEDFYLVIYKIVYGKKIKHHNKSKIQLCQKKFF